MTPHVTVPSRFGYDYEDVFLQAADNTRLHGWLIAPSREHGGPPRGTIYFLHGNAENISTHFRATLWLLNHGYEVFALDYRGYGLSEGKPDVPEVFNDIDAGANWLLDRRRQQHSPALFIYGQSLGGSLAISHAQRSKMIVEQFDGLISEAAFTRFDTIARHVASRHWLTWSAQYPAQWLIGRQYDPLDAIATLDTLPKLLIHSRDDQIIPIHFGLALMEAAAEPKQWLVTTGPHIRAAANPAVREAILGFLQQHADQESSPVR